MYRNPRKSDPYSSTFDGYTDTLRLEEDVWGIGPVLDAVNELAWSWAAKDPARTSDLLGAKLAQDARDGLIGGVEILSRVEEAIRLRSGAKAWRNPPVRPGKGLLKLTSHAGERPLAGEGLPPVYEPIQEHGWYEDVSRVHAGKTTPKPRRYDYREERAFVRKVKGKPNPAPRYIWESESPRAKKNSGKRQESLYKKRQAHTRRLASEIIVLQYPDNDWNDDEPSWKVELFHLLGRNPLPKVMRDVFDRLSGFQGRLPSYRSLSGLTETEADWLRKFCQREGANWM